MNNVFITGDKFKLMCDDYIDLDKHYIDISQKPKNIFVKTDYIWAFYKNIMPMIDYNFILYTHNSDIPINESHSVIYEDPRIVNWYAMNCNVIHSKLKPIPIGIANEIWPHGNTTILNEVIETEVLQNNLCYCNFEISTNPCKRQQVSSIIQSKKFIDYDFCKLPFREYLTKLKSYKYAISPPGNGVDCHRIWESIYLGVIPIVEKHLALKDFKDLPILFVNSFTDLTESMLNESYSKYKLKNKDKAYIQYYTNTWH